MRPRYVASLVAIGLASLAAACDSVSGPGAGSGLIIRGEPALEDTVTANARIVVEVSRLSHNHPARVQVEFRYGQVTSPESGLCCMYYVRPADTTDANGRAEALLVHGTAAGAQYLVVEARAFGQATAFTSDSVIVRTTPGQPARILIAPRDTALFQGDTDPLALAAADRYGNRRMEIVQLTAATAGVSVSASVVRADSGPSRQIVRAQLGAIRDSAWLSIVPRGELAVGTSPQYVGQSGDLAVVKLDGSGLRSALVTSQPGDYGAQAAAMNVRWDPTGTRLVYDRLETTDRLFIGDLAGVAHPLIYPSPFSDEFNPDFSPDGAWVYFAARSPGLSASSLWRVHPDGTALEQAPFEPDGSESRPAVSPDGQWLAYSSDGFIHVRSLVTGARTPLQVSGTAPRWSPAGDAIAYVVSADYAGYSGLLRIVSPDGNNDRLLVTDEAYAPGLDWTPDGKYIVAKTGNYGLLELIVVATGETIPLPYSGRLFTPAWRPN
jgi:hypothetical protein